MNLELLLILPLLTATVALATPPEAIQRVTLDERVVVNVPVSTIRVTTISFPGPIAAIDAVKQQYCLYVTMQKQRNQVGRVRLYPVQLPEQRIDGVTFQPSTKYLRNEE